MYRSLFLPLAGLLAGWLSAAAQARTTAIRTNEIEVFGAVTYLNPDFGTKRDIGYTFGADLTHHLRLFNAGLEARYTSANGLQVDQNSFVGGLRLSKDYTRYRPYLTGLVGHGKIKYDHPEIFGFINYTHDDSTVYALGGGVDVDVTRNFAIKADIQSQYWNLGSASATLNPLNVSVGVVYRIPFSALRPHR